MAYMKRLRDWPLVCHFAIFCKMAYIHPSETLQQTAMRLARAIKTESHSDGFAKL